MHQLRILYARHAEPIAHVGLGHDWETFKSTLKKIRQRGYATSLGDYNPGILSIAAPLFNREDEVLGSLALTASDNVITFSAFQEYASQVLDAAASINTNIAASQNVAALPARALG
jgi:DNA-binding IclR family transcriptional regulator